MKILVTGYGRHGKDTFCELSGKKFASSSWAALEEAIWPSWGSQLYETKEECFERRHEDNNRAVWYRLIQQYNTPDKTRLARAILANNDIYCGMRCKEELAACKEAGIFDAIIWVDASKRVPPESSESMSITKDMCDIVITNNGTESEFKLAVASLMAILEKDDEKLSWTL